MNVAFLCIALHGDSGFFFRSLISLLNQVLKVNIPKTRTKHAGSFSFMW